MLGQWGIIITMNNTTTRENTMDISPAAAHYIISNLWAEQVAELRSHGIKADEEHYLTRDECVEWLQDILTGDYVISWTEACGGDICICLR